MTMLRALMEEDQRANDAQTQARLKQFAQDEQTRAATAVANRTAAAAETSAIANATYTNALAGLNRTLTQKAAAQLKARSGCGASTLPTAAELQANHPDWTSADISEYLRQGQYLDPQEQMALSWWTEQDVGYRTANKEARQDRAMMLAELETYKAGFNESWMGAALGREKMAWDAKVNQTMQQIREQYASMGRVASPLVMAEVGRRMTAQAAEALQLKRYQLEQERDQRKQFYLTSMNNVLSNTERQTIDPAAAAAMMQAMGQGAATVTPATI